MHLIPAGHRVLIQPDQVQKEHDLGNGFKLAIVMNERAEKAAMIIGTIVAVGQNAWKAFDQGDPWAKVGDKVYYSKYAGKFLIDPESGVEYLVINDEDVQAIVTKEVA